jgi:hypothetical protein
MGYGHKPHFQKIELFGSGLSGLGIAQICALQASLRFWADFLGKTAKLICFTKRFTVDDLSAIGNRKSLIINWNCHGQVSL